MLFIFIYIIGVVLTALLIRYSNEELRSGFAAEDNGVLMTALVLWPLFLVLYFFTLCFILAKEKK